MFLGTDGKFHMRLHDCAGQEIIIPLPLGLVPAHRCNTCGEPREYEYAVRPSNNAVHLTAAAGGSRDDNDTEPQVTADR